MRVIVFFDLPTITVKDRKNYRDFRKFLISNGFMMMQESVYSKISKNKSAADLLADKVRKRVPPSGLVQLLIVTEKQYSNMEILIGNIDSEYITDDRKLIIL